MGSLLIVDDDPDTRFLVRRVMELSLGAPSVIREASSGEEALKSWLDLQPDVMVLDHVMSGRSGLAVATEILSEKPDQAIVLFTAHQDMELKSQAAKIGVRACLAKSELERLRTTVLALLQEG